MVSSLGKLSKVLTVLALVASSAATIISTIKED
ncbi:hypothetical protein LIS04_203 [Listeria phage LIS04]|nr:hypothetical protein LIS04_203 [Listeria phage LIS04]